MAKLLERSYDSGEAKSRVLCNYNDVNQMLRDLCDSGLAYGDIVSYSEQSYMFRTEGIFLPYFIEKGLGDGKTIVRASVPVDQIAENWKAITQKVYENVSNQESIDFIAETAEFGELAERLYHAGKSDIVNCLAKVFREQWFKYIKAYAFLYSSEDGKESYISIKLSPKIDWDLILEGYKAAILHQNRLYKSKLKSEDLMFCPLDHALCSDLLAIVSMVTIFTRELRTAFANEMMTQIESCINKEIDEYQIENQSNYGIKRDNNVITYYKNTLSPEGTIALVRDKISGKDLFVGLAKEFEYLPIELSIEEHKDLFTEVIPLKKITMLRLFKEEKKSPNLVSQDEESIDEEEFDEYHEPEDEEEEDNRYMSMLRDED